MALLRQLEELDADVVCLEELSDYWTYVLCSIRHTPASLSLFVADCLMGARTMYAIPRIGFLNPS